MSEQDTNLVSVEKLEPTQNLIEEQIQPEKTTFPSETTQSNSNSNEVSSTSQNVELHSENSTEPTENVAINSNSGEPNPSSPQISSSSHNKEKKRKNRDEQLIAMSPELTGKRQRKVSSLLSDFEVDKKTIEKTLEVPSSENQSGESAPAPPRLSIRIKTPLASTGKKEVVMTHTEAQEKAKKLPKGYTFEIIAEKTPTTASDTQIIEGKRERKKSPQGEVSTDEQSKKKQKKDKQSGLSIVEVPSESKVPTDKLNAIENNLAAISQTLEKTLNDTPNSPVQITTSLPSFLTPESPDPEPEPPVKSYTTTAYAPPIKYDAFEKKKKGRKKKGQDTSFEKFDSDDDDEEFELDSNYDEERPKKKLKQHTPGKRGPVPKAPKVKNPTKVEVEVEEPIFDAQKAQVLLQLHKILLELKKHKASIFFQQPVDPVRDGVPDYFNVIKKPMDFHTMEEKISDGDYNNPEEFCADMRLIFQNATTYNPPTSKVHSDALTLWRIFEKQVTPHGLSKTIPKTVVPPKPKVKSLRESPIPPLPSLPPPTFPMESQIDVEVKKQMESAIQELREAVKQVNGEIKRIKQQKFGIAQSPKPPRPQKQQTTPKQTTTAPKKESSARPQRGRPKVANHQTKEEKEMTFEEKRTLSQNISGLSAEHLGKIVQIIQSKNPALAQQTPELIEIDLEELDTPTLRALERYINYVQGKASRPNVANTDNTIRGVQKKLREIESKTGNSRRRYKPDDEEDIEIGDERHNAAYPSVVIEKDKRAVISETSDSSSSSSSSSESESSSSPSENEKKKKQEKREPMQIEAPAPVPTTNTPTPAVDKPVSEKKDRPAPRSPLREEKSEPLKPPQATDAMDDSIEPLPILPTTNVKKEIELKNLDSWANFTSDSTSAPEPSQTSKPKDEAWAKFQTKDMLNKQREKELQEQEERERQLKAEREAERRRLHEQQLKDAQEAEEKRKREEEENQLAYQRELAAKREKEKRERELSSASINMLDQYEMMSSFEQEAREFQAERPAILQMFKLKEEPTVDEKVEEDKEDGEIGTL